MSPGTARPTPARTSRPFDDHWETLKAVPLAPRVRPELVARNPNEVWSWDITKLKGPVKGVWYDLYVVLDILSRYVVAWCVAPAEPGELAKALIEDAVARHKVPPGQLSVHADRRSAMTSVPVVRLYKFLGISRSHSRPHVCLFSTLTARHSSAPSSTARPSPSVSAR